VLDRRELSPNEEACLLAELQENSARNDLTGIQRKVYAAEIGRLLVKIAEDCNSENYNDKWFLEITRTTGVTHKTLYNWWNAFCQEAGLSLTPRQALAIHKQQFFDWLDEQQRLAAEEKARKETEMSLRRQQEGGIFVCVYTIILPHALGWYFCIHVLFLCMPFERETDACPAHIPPLAGV